MRLHCHRCRCWLRRSEFPWDARYGKVLQPCLSCRAGSRRARRRRLPSAPLRQAMGARSNCAVAREVGVNEAWVRRIRKQPTVNLATADRFLTALGRHIDEVYV